MRDISNLTAFVDGMQKAFPRYTFDLNFQGGGWARCFVLYDGVSLGRINFQPAENGYSFYGIKHYKPYDYEYSAEDAFFYQFRFWLETGIIINIDNLVEQAKLNKQKKTEGILQWRAEHPTKLVLNKKKGRMQHASRGRISTSWKGELGRLIEEEKIKELGL